MSQSNQGSEIKRLRAENKQLKEQIAKYLVEKRDDSARQDMKDDGKIDEQEITPAVAKQMITAFEQDYDSRAKQKINDLKQRSGADHPDVVKYEKAKAEYEKLKEKFS